MCYIEKTKKYIGYIKQIWYKALTLDLHPELLVEHPGAAPAVCHVLYEPPLRELLAQPVSNDLVWVVSEFWENIHVH